jgi:drug/metabolite transporter (DMT)-like permease
MTRWIMVLLVGLVLEAAGVVLISKGQKELKTRFEPRPAAVLRLAREAVTSPSLLLGVALEAGFFGCLLFLLSRADVSFVWPLTSLSLVVTTFTAKWVLKEQVTALRWCGVAFILFGAAIVIYTERQKSAAGGGHGGTMQASPPGTP